MIRVFFLDEFKVIKCLEYVLPPLNVAKNQHKKGFAVFVFNGISLFLTFGALVCCPYCRLRQRWKPVGSTGTGRVAGRVETLRPVGQAG